MPSGAKKRKAAKRKKELAVHPDSHPPTLPGGHDGERDDDDGDLNGNGNESGPEITSPRSQDGHDPLEAEEEGAATVDEEGKRGQGGGSTESGGVVDRAMESSENDSRATGDSSAPDKEKPEEELAETAAAEIEGEEIPPPPTSAPILISESDAVCIEHAPSKKCEGFDGSGEEPPPIGGHAEMEWEQQQPVTSGSAERSVLPIPDEVVQVREVPVVSASEDVVPVSDPPVENLQAQSVVEAPEHRTEEKVVPQRDASHEHPHDSAETCSGTKSRDVGGITEPQVVLSAQAEHRASWMGCCGLFDALMSSSR